MKHLLRSFSFSASFAFLAFLLTVATFLPTGPVNAQGPPAWTQRGTFTGSQIHIVKFLDAVGAPLVGFVSDGPEIWRTANGGTTWAMVPITGTTPIPFVSGWVNDISFKDAMNGVAIIQGNANPADHGVLITSTGGATWTFKDGTGTPDSGNGIYWNPSNNYIFVSSLDKGFVYSPDGGATWKVIDTNKYYTGFAFTSGSRGVVATKGSNPYQILPINYWKYTTNGGVSWDTSYMFYETWQPVAVPTTETYFAATINIGGSAIMRSDNDGYSFREVPTFAEGSDVLNDCMQGDGCSLFAASTDLPTGMWYSTNDGGNWQTMPPPLPPAVAPNPPVNTRFYVSPTKIWSFTTNVLWYTPRVLTPPIHVWPDTINFTNASCDIATDTVIHIFGCNCSNNDSLMSSSVSQTQTQDQLTVNSGTVPRPLCTPGSTGPFGNPDAVTISYKPTSPLADVGGVVLRFSQNGTEYDTTIAVTGNAAIPGLSVPTKRIALYAPACGGEVDTCFTITNTGCVPIWITATYTTSDSYCILWYDTLQQDLKLDPTNPSQKFCIYFRPSLQKIATLGSIQFQWTSDHITYYTTKLLEVEGLTTTTIQPSFSGFHIGFTPGHPLSCCYGGIPTDTTIYFLNSTCDTLTLNQPYFSGATNPNEFTLNPSKPPLVWPVKLAPGGLGLLLLSVHIDCRQGTDSAKVVFNYSVGTTGTDCDNLLIASDTASLAVKSAGPITVPTFKPSSVTFNGVSCCDSSQIRTLTINTGCVYDTMTKVKFDSAGGSFYLVQPITVPQTDHPDSSFTIQFGYLPNGGASAGSITLTFSDGTKLTIPITGSCSNVAEAALSMNEINFDTLPCGTSKCDTVWIKNASCGPIQIGGIVLPGPANPAFTLTPPAAGTPLPRGDSALMLVCLNPAVNNSSGSLSSVAILAILNANGTPASFDTVTLLAYVEPIIAAYSLTQLFSDTICDTDTLDESFSFTNIGQCYTYKITGFTATDNGKVTVTPVNTSYPVYVRVGDKQIFDVHFDPQRVAQNLTGTITLTDSGGNNITVPYDITVNLCNGQTPVLTLHDTNTDFITTNCTPLTRVFAVAASSGTVTVTSVTLTAGTQFTETLSQSLPYTVSTTDTLYVTITYSPDAAGPNAATLTVGNLPPLNLTGSVVGTLYNAKFGISTTSPLLDSPNVDLNFTISLDSLIPDDIGMTNLTIVVNEPGGLLTMRPPSLTGIGNWQADASRPPGESSPWTIHLKYTGPTTPGQMIAGGPMATFKAYTAIGKINTTSVSIGAPDIFNDTNFARCKMSAESDGSSIPFQILLSCSDSVIVKALNGDLQSVTNIEVIPSPAHKDGGAATLHFTSNVSAPMTVDVLNVLGNSVAQLANGPVTKGDHALAIPTNEMPEGAYFVRISMNGYTVVRKFVLEKE